MFTGTGTALVTPFRRDGSLDEPTLRALIKRQIDAGIDFLVPCGTTGESPTLTYEEHLRVVEIAVELAAYDASYEEMATKFIDHFLWIAKAMNHVGPQGMWDEEDGFYYDVLRYPDGHSTRLKVRSMV